jgi:hypothetical protein
MNWYKKAHMYSADEDHGDGEGVFGHPDDYMDKRSPGKIRTMTKNDLNGELNHFLSPDGKTEYFKDIPLDDIFDIVESVDMMPVQEDGTKWQGMLLGEEGRATISLMDSEDTFEDLHLHMQWHKMPSGNFEINAYVN